MKPKKPKPKAKTEKERREQAAQIMSKRARSVREVGDIPEPKDPERRASCENDLARFLLTYLPRSFYLPFSEDHLTVLRKLERAILHGGQFAEAMPRGDGKTTMVGGASLWAILYGHRRFLAIIGAEAEHAKKIMQGIMMECSQNPMIREDFPELCVPVRHIDGIGQRAAGQLYEGERTHIRWNKDLVVCPMIPGSKCAGSMIIPRGLTAAIRGIQYKTSKGEVLRPDFALLDDPQTEESAKSPSQCEERENLITKAVLGLAGPDKRISAVMCCTVIYRGDLSDRFLNHKQHPEWQGECMKMVYEWPDEQEEKWAEYAALRREGLLAGDQGQRATDFYKANKEAMDAGAEVAWPERYNEDEISALQHAENLRIDRGDPAFFSEYQNSPEEAHPALYDITPEVVLTRLNGFKMFAVPDTAFHVGGFIDVNPAYGLHWALCWFMNDLTGGILAYGKFPVDEKVPLVPKDAAESEEQLIFRGLDSVCAGMNEMQIMRGAERALIDLLMIDCGYQMKTIFQYVNARERTFAGIRYLACSRGWGSRRYKQYKAIIPGNNWHLTEFAGKGKVIVHNADSWLLYAQKALLLPPGAPGSITIYGENARQHEKLARHLAAQRLIEFARLDTFDAYNWQMQPGEHNDLGDCLTGCCVGASFRGCDPNIKSVGAAQAAAAGKSRRPRVKHHEI